MCSIILALNIYILTPRRLCLNFVNDNVPVCHAAVVVGGDETVVVGLSDFR